MSVVWLGYPPMGPGTEGTVGGAQRYQAAPAGDKSAALGSMTVQAFLQTDTFDRLMKNPDTQGAPAEGGDRSRAPPGARQPGPRPGAGRPGDR